MADILIQNMNMPKERKMFVIETDGSVWEQIADTSYFCTGYKAVELPPHGDLKDGWVLFSLFERELGSSVMGQRVKNLIINSPTIVEASK